MTVSRTVFRAENLQVTYQSSRGATQALDNFNTTLTQGEFLSILGPSGCSKSTLMKVAASLLTSSAGIAELDSTPITGPRRDVGIVFQQATLVPWQTVLQNVMLPIHTLGMDIKQGEIQARALLRLVGLEKFEHHYPHELSGGMQQRVDIARGLIHDPSLLLMDEPFAALDALSREHYDGRTPAYLDGEPEKRHFYYLLHPIPEAVFLSTKIIVLSPRLAKIIREIEVDLPLRRNEETMTSARFNELCTELRYLFFKQQH